jgi:DNA-binding GntR family transcriptional regulator
MSETRYAQVARDLMAGIEDGRFPVGSLLPTELELCDRYAASRHTIRSAIQELQDLGLVSRRKKVGTRVEAASPQTGYRQSLGSVDDLMQFGVAHTREVQAIVPVTTNRALAKTLGCAVNREWLCVSSLRRTGEEGAPPIAWTDAYVDAAYADLAEAIRSSPDVLISGLIEKRYGRTIANIRQDVDAVLVPPELATPLAVEAGTPALRIIRYYQDSAGAAFEITITIHPAGRFKFSMLLRRERAS